MIVLTASDRPQDLQQALALGALSYMIKFPFSHPLTDLLAKLALQ